MVQFVEVNPVLPVRNVTEAVRYYGERLGFALVGQDDADSPRYAVVKRDGVELHLQWHDSTPSTDSGQAHFHNVEKLNLRFVIKDIDTLFAEYSTQDVFHDRTALRETAWGTREFAFYDPDNNGLTFYADL